MSPTTRRRSPTRRCVDAANWGAIERELGELGYALTPPLLGAAEAVALIGLYDRDEVFRSTIEMARHRFGEGEYRYFAAPLPELVAELRQALYPHLLGVARGTRGSVGRLRGPRISRSGWRSATRPVRPGRRRFSFATARGTGTPSIAILYGECVFPLQVVINLTDPTRDYRGGEFLLLEQRARAQSRGTAVVLPFASGLVFATRDRPVPSARGWSAAPLRHGVSVVRSGRRYTLGLLFHDAA